MIVDGYVRVSQVGGRSGQRFISPSVQREQIAGWVALNGHVLGEIFEELDESGSRVDRPLLSEAVARIERGESQGLVVAKMDRFGRSLLDGLSVVDRIQAAGGTFVSVADGLDLATPTGKLILRIMLSMAEWELDRIRANWESARERAVARGVYMSPVAPLGYQRRRDGRLRIDPIAGPIVSSLFQLRADGESLRDVAEFLNESELKPQRGAACFTPNTVHGVLRNRAYLGESRCGEHFRLDAHEPLVEPTLWQAAQRPFRPKRAARPTLLGGMLRCAGCRMVLHSGSGSSTESPTYVCGRRSGAGVCPRPVRISGAEIEPLVEDLFFRLIDGRRTDAAASRAAAKAKSKFAKAEADLVAYRDNPRFLRTLGAERFIAGLSKRQDLVEEALLEQAAAERGARAVSAPTRHEVESSWSERSIDQRKALISNQIDCLFVFDGEQPLTERVHVCRAGRAPAGMPRRGRGASGIQPFSPGAQERRGGRQLREPDLWSEKRIRRALQVALEGQEWWPSYNLFAKGGHARLHAQLMRFGGPWYWCREFGLAPTSKRMVRPWNERLVRDALTPFLRGWDHWPTRKEFAASGMEPVQLAAVNHGGLGYWAAEFGLTQLRPGPRPKQRP